MKYGYIIERLMQHFTEGKFLKEGELAKVDFIEWAGGFDEISNEFEAKMAQFTDWYLFTRPTSFFGIPPIRVSLEKSGFKLDPSLKSAYEDVVSSYHSLFEFLKLKRGDVYVRDIFSGDKLRVKNSLTTAAFHKGGIFEARLISREGESVFSDSFCFHPLSVSRYILSCVKSMSGLEGEEKEGAKAELIHKLFRMWSRLEYYKHIPPEEIYASSPKSVG